MPRISLNRLLAHGRLIWSFFFRIINLHTVTLLVQLWDNLIGSNMSIPYSLTCLAPFWLVHREETPLARQSDRHLQSGLEKDKYQFI